MKKSIDNFKIIAIRTGDMAPIKVGRGSSIQKLDPLRNLSKNKIYPFRNEYSFPKGIFNEIEYHPDKDISLYQVKASKNSIPININAIVGSNGSGKSTLIELLYWANYNIGSALNLLEDDEGRKKKPFEFLDLELLYSIKSNTIAAIIFKDGAILTQQYTLKNRIFQSAGAPLQIKRLEDLKDFFYSIVINYSHYGLNSTEIGDWINSLFHKNDGYQTPIVLNPMRKKGDIDINREKHLLKRRLIANILEFVEEGKEKDSLRNLANDKIAAKLELTYNPLPDSNLEEPLPKEVFQKLNTAFKEYFNFSLASVLSNNDLFINITLSYIHKKLIKMSDYRMFRRYRDKKSKQPAIKDINAYIRRIRGSDSHIVFKVKGAILYLKYYHKLFNGGIRDLSKPIEVSIAEFSQKIVEINDAEEFFVNTFMLAPPSFFYVDILPHDGTPFGALSSGEKQKIHSISSIVYHLINLNSVEQLKEDEETSEAADLVHYNYINVVLDEIELYYHPDWQRMYIADLISYIAKINPSNLKFIKGLNITFLTHSPYILSDIPQAFVLKLKKGDPQKNDDKENTFGSNIHDLLANDFYMEDGFMGELAKQKIEETIKYLNLKQCQRQIKDLKGKKELNAGEQSVLKILESEEKILALNEFNTDPVYYEKIVDLIGEPVIKGKIKSMFSELLSDSERKRIAKQRIDLIAKEAGLEIKVD